VTDEWPALSAAQLPEGTLIHVTFLIFAIALTVRDVLWLRVLTIVAYSLHIVRIELIGDLTLNSWLGWYAAFVIINTCHASWLIYERRLSRLGPGERALAMVAFPALDRQTLKRLLRVGRWYRMQPGEAFTTAGTHPDVVAVVRSGQIDVRRDGQTLATIGPGHFVAEMSFLTGAPATADTVARSDVELFVWDQVDLARRFERDPQVKLAFYSAVGPDLVMKITQTQVASAASAERETDDGERHTAAAPANATESSAEPFATANATG
jgi:CRP-like cAMP-binding protein